MIRAHVGKLKANSPKRLSAAFHSTRLWVAVGVVGVLSLLIVAFVDLLIVSVQSQPECVSHTRADDPNRSNHTAAKSSC